MLILNQRPSYITITSTLSIFLLFKSLFRIKINLKKHLVDQSIETSSSVGKSSGSEQIDGLLYVRTHLVSANPRAT